MTNNHVVEGASKVTVALDAARAELRTAKTVNLDYLVITTPDLTGLPDTVPPGAEARILIAARIGSTRLIDNMPLTLGSAPEARLAEPHQAAPHQAQPHQGGS